MRAAQSDASSSMRSLVYGSHGRSPGGRSSGFLSCSCARHALVPATLPARAAGRGRAVFQLLTAMPSCILSPRATVDRACGSKKHVTTGPSAAPSWRFEAGATPDGPSPPAQPPGARLANSMIFGPVASIDRRDLPAFDLVQRKPPRSDKQIGLRLVDQTQHPSIRRCGRRHRGAKSSASPEFQACRARYAERYKRPRGRRRQVRSPRFRHGNTRPL